MAGISKQKTQAMQAYAMKHLRIRPLPDEVEALISQTVVEGGFASRSDAYQHLLKSGTLKGIDVGGEALNSEEVVVGLVSKFGTTRETARRHVARAARRNRHPDRQWADRRGGKRAGAGRPRQYVIDVRNRRAIISQKVETADGFTYVEAINWEALAERAAHAVMAQGGAVTVSGQYVCPKWLVKTAIWAGEVV